MAKINYQTFSLLAIILGVALGIFFPSEAGYVEFLGKIFLSLLKVLILPLIVLSLFLAIAGISDINILKKLGIKTLTYYLGTTALAVLTGLVLANIFIFKNESNSIEGVSTKSTPDYFDRIFSDNIFNSLANGEILHIVVFVLLFSMAFLFLPAEKKKPVLAIADSLNEVVMKLIEWVLKLAPLGILSLVWSSVSTFDASTFSNVKSFFAATAIAALVHCFVSLPLIAKLFGKFNAFKYFWKVKQAIIISFSTASSAATLPVSTKLVEEQGVSEKVARFVLPIGATLNMDGSALYQSILAMLFVSLAGIEISLAEQLLLFIFIALSSAGTAGIPSGGIVMMTLVIEQLKIPNPEYYLGLYVMLDRFWDYPITSVNVWGDLIASKTIDSAMKRREI